MFSPATRRMKEKNLQFPADGIALRTAKGIN
jgi:hypothetical protein